MEIIQSGELLAEVVQGGAPGIWWGTLDREEVSMEIVGMVARSPNRGMLLRAELVDTILKGGGRTCKDACHIVKCLFDIVNDLCMRTK